MKASSRVYLAGRRPLAPRPRAALKRLLSEVLEEHDQPGTVNVVFVDDEEIRNLHSEYLDRDETTDVITFPMRGDDPEGPPDDGLLGEIVVSVETARRESKRRNQGLDRELVLYTVHGLLHLLGFDDVDPVDRRLMRLKERKYLERFKP